MQNILFLIGLKQTDVMTSWLHLIKISEFQKHFVRLFSLPKAVLLCQTIVSLVTRISPAFNSPS
jgi:hypothetical protein